jgi:hypothetical protein
VRSNPRHNHDTAWEQIALTEVRNRWQLVLHPAIPSLGPPFASYPQFVRDRE